MSWERVVRGSQRWRRREADLSLNGARICRAPAGLFLFLFSMGLLEGLDGDEIADKVKTLWVPILIANWQVSSPSCPTRPLGPQ